MLSGTLAALMLLLRKSLAVAGFAINIAALLLQFSNPLSFAFGAGYLQMMILPLFIIAVAVVELLLTRKWQKAGWLN